MRYVVMFNNNRYFKDNMTFNQYYRFNSKFEVTVDRSVSPPIIDRRERTEAEAKAFIEEAKQKQLEAFTTSNIDEARLFPSKNAASSAAARGGYRRKDGDFTVIEVFITTQPPIKE
jgi:hypothetical protein